MALFAYNLSIREQKQVNTGSSLASLAKTMSLKVFRQYGRE